MRYVFTTSGLRAVIDPVTPVDNERLVDTGTSIIIDSYEVLTNVTVGGTLVWNGTFQNSWTGVSLVIAGGFRLVCDPPAPLTHGGSYAVTATSASYSLDYSFAVGLLKTTTTNDVTSPRVTEATDAYAWVGYVRNNEDSLPPGIEQGNLYLRKALPALTGEVRIIPAEDAEVGYDPVSGKVYIFYTRIGKVFAMTADPADLPSTQLQPRTITDDTRQRWANDGFYQKSDIVDYPPIKQLIDEPVEQRWANDGFYQKSDIVDYPPLKLAITETAEQRLAGEGKYERDLIGPWSYVPLPVIITGFKTETTYVNIRIQRPTGGEEKTLIQGFYIVKWSAGGTHRIVGYVSMAPYAKSPEIVSYVELGATDREFWVTNSYRDDGTDGENDPVSVGPVIDVRAARKNKGSTDDDTADRYFYFTVTEPDAKPYHVGRIAVTVYDDPAFDADNVPIALQYTSHRATGPGDTAEVYFQHARIQTLKGTGKWVTLEWVVEDAGFRSFQNGGSDFRLDIGTKRVCVNRVQLNTKTDVVEFTDVPMNADSKYSVIAVYKRYLGSTELVYSSETAGGIASVPTIGDKVQQRLAGAGEYFKMTTTGYDPVGP